MPNYAVSKFGVFIPTDAPAGYTLSSATPGSVLLAPAVPEPARPAVIATGSGPLPARAAFT